VFYGHREPFLSGLLGSTHVLHLFGGKVTGFLSFRYTRMTVAGDSSFLVAAPEEEERARMTTGIQDTVISFSTAFSWPLEQKGNGIAKWSTSRVLAPIGEPPSQPFKQNCP